MKRILIVKVTSLGDIVQALPVIADIKQAFPGVQVDWAADEAFAEVVHWSQRVDRVLCAPLRRFKKARRWSDLKAIGASIGELPCPARYFPEASSIDFPRSLRYGFGCLAVALRFRFARWGWAPPVCPA